MPAAAEPVRRGLEVLRAEGLVALLFGVLGATVYRRLVIFERDLDGLPAADPPGLEVAVCGAERLAEYGTLRPRQRAVAERRLAEGQRWFGTWLDGRLVSVRWLATGAPAIDYLGLRLPLAADEVYIHDSYTDPAHRRRGVAAGGLRLLFPLLAAEGRSRAVCACLPENREAWRSIVRAGFRATGKTGWVAVGPWRREFVHRQQSTAERASRLLREEGLRSVVFGVLAETVYRRLAVAERELDSREAPDPLGLRSRFLEAGDLDEYEALRPGQRAVAARRLAEGSRCFGGWLDGRLVSVRWLAAGAPWIDYLGMPIRLAADEIYHFDSYVDPGLRGRGITTTSQLVLSPLLAAEGVRRSVRAILPENRPALREAAKVGYRITGSIGYVRLGPWRREFRRRRPL